MAFEQDAERRELTDLADTARRISAARSSREETCLARVKAINVAVERRAAAVAAAARAAERAAATPADAALLRWAAAKADARAKQMAEIAAAARKRGESVGRSGGTGGDESSDEFGYEDDEEALKDEGGGEGEGEGEEHEHALPPPGVTAEQARDAYVRAVLSRAQAMAAVSEEGGAEEEKEEVDATVSAAGEALLGLAERGKGLAEPLDHQPPARPTPVRK